MSKKEEPSPRFRELFNPLSARMRIGDRAASQEDEPYQALIRGYRELESAHDPLQREIADFVIHNSMQPHPYGTVRRVELHPAHSSHTGTYSPQESAVRLYPGRFRNPIETFVHEGTHALEHLRMRTYQNEAPGYLASLGLGNLRSEPQDQRLQAILEGAQEILPVGAFRRHYTYREHFRPRIEKGYGALSKLRGRDIQDFSQAIQRLDALRGTREPVQGNPFFSLSEFPAYAMQFLHQPWDVNSRTNPQSAAFLHGIMRGVQRHFGKLGLAEHHGIEGAFEQRLDQLRGVDPSAIAAGGLHQAARDLQLTPYWREAMSRRRLGGVGDMLSAPAMWETRPTAAAAAGGAGIAAAPVAVPTTPPRGVVGGGGAGGPSIGMPAGGGLSPSPRGRGLVRLPLRSGGRGGTPWGAAPAAAGGGSGGGLSHILGGGITTVPATLPLRPGVGGAGGTTWGADPAIAALHQAAQGFRQRLEQYQLSAPPRTPPAAAAAAAAGGGGSGGGLSHILGGSGGPGGMQPGATAGGGQQYATSD